MICSSVNRDRFIRPSLRWAGLYLRLEEFQGVTSAECPEALRSVGLWLDDGDVRCAAGPLLLRTRIGGWSFWSCPLNELHGARGVLRNDNSICSIGIKANKTAL